MKSAKINHTKDKTGSSCRLLYATFVKLIGLYLLISLATRIVLLFNEQTQVAFSITEWLQIFLLGAANDLFVGIIALFFIWLDIIFLSRSKYKTPWGYIILAIITACLIYVSFFNTIFNEYGSAVPKIVKGFLWFKFISFGIRLFIPKVRNIWSYTIYSIVFFLYVFLIFFNLISEYFFWSEFGVRYNFIAVDYLIYTNEVIGNIFESYPIIPLLIGLTVVSAGISYCLLRKTRNPFDNYMKFKTKLLVSLLYFVLVAVSCFMLNFNTRFQNSDNVYVNELQSNGLFKFYNAFMNSQLDYKTFYSTMPDDEAYRVINREYNGKGMTIQQVISDSLPEVHKNIVLITVESLSAAFMERYGNTENITPNLDKLAKESIVFDNLYATGNRTVRGLEAVTLCLPPSPGESIIKQPNNANLFSTAKILRERGYKVQYLYGGDSYFDNMKTFFGGNGYEIIDKSCFSENEITFSNIWGVCDEDIFARAIKVFNENTTTKKPFFAHIMTVSNHRPFTYPEGKIDISPQSKSRNGGVKYTDYAIGKFIEEARIQPWFDNTIFVIIADHCASSAGKTNIPLGKYHIPALIYAPGYIHPKEVKTLVSQIDIMPTVFGLLHFSYESHFYGKNTFAPDYKSRAFVATYQNLGYWENDVLTILSPVRRIDQYKVDTIGNYEYRLDKAKADTVYIKNAIANYQTIKK